MSRHTIEPTPGPVTLTLPEPRPPEIREELVARVRREIALGVYENPDKWEIAIAKLMASLD